MEGASPRFPVCKPHNAVLTQFGHLGTSSSAVSLVSHGHSFISRPSEGPENMGLP